MSDGKPRSDSIERSTGPKTPELVTPASDAAVPFPGIALESPSVVPGVSIAPEEQSASFPSSKEPSPSPTPPLSGRRQPGDVSQMSPPDSDAGSTGSGIENNKPFAEPRDVSDVTDDMRYIYEDAPRPSFEVPRRSPEDKPRGSATPPETVVVPVGYESFDSRKTAAKGISAKLAEDIPSEIAPSAIEMEEALARMPDKDTSFDSLGGAKDIRAEESVDELRLGSMAEVKAAESKPKRQGLMKKMSKHTRRITKRWRRAGPAVELQSISELGDDLVRNADLDIDLNSDADSDKAPVPKEPEPPPPCSYLLLGIRNGKLSFGWAVFNLVLVDLAFGMLTVPYVMSQWGIATGLIMMYILALLSQYLMYVLAKNYIATRIASYAEMAKNILGVPGKIVVNIALLIGSWGAMILLFLVIKEQVYILLQKATSDIKVEDWVFLLGVALGISFPLSFFHQYDKYAVSSILGVVMVFWVFFTILVTAPWSSLETNVKQYPTDFIVASAALPLFAYAYNNIWAFLTILHYMDRPTREDIGFLIVASNTITTIILTFIGVVGYLSFGDRTSSVIINSMKYDGWRDVVVIICRILVATQFALAIPICVQVIRSSLFATRFAVWVRLDKHPLFNHIWVTTLSFGTALLIACFKVDTSTIQGIITAITFSSASLIVPAVLDWHYWGKVESKKATLCRVFVCIICTIGCAIFLLGFVTNCFPQSIPKAQFTNQLSRILSRSAPRKIPPEFKHLLEAVDLIPNDFQS